MDFRPSRIDAITLFVSDLSASKRFYQETFGLGVHFEDAESAVFQFGNVLVNLLVVDAAPELVEPASVGKAEGVRFQLTVPVDDVDATCAELQGRGVKLLNGPMGRPWGIRTACFQDPDGYVWEIAH